MKIPTLLGMAVILTLIALSGLYYYYRPVENQNFSVEISDLKVVNVSDTSATVVWQSFAPAMGQVNYSESESLSESAFDNRDRESTKPRTIHFVTLLNLKPDTTYHYKIKNDAAFYPPESLKFKTAKPLDVEELDFSFQKPLKGTILNTNLNPVDESLIFLNIEGAQELATFSSTAGNFVLPLTKVLSSDLSQQLTIKPNTQASLFVKKGVLNSEVKINISDKTVNLPPITIGSNLDLMNFEAAPIGKITLGTETSGGLDFNNDGRVNSLDLAILREAARPETLRGTDTQSRFDINQDGQVNTLDIEAFSQKLGGN